MTGTELEWAGRIATLETEMVHLKKSNEEIKVKLDQLLELRSKGVGAFWLASLLLGTSIVGTLVTFIDWVRGVH